MDLGHQAKQAHWNVKGPHFVSLHELFDKVAEELGDHADDLAERVVQLGGVAQGTIQTIVKRSRLPAYANDIASGRAHLTAVADALGKFGSSTRQAIDAATESGDADTADLFTEISRGMDKLLWMVEAHLQAKE
jgi:starvation-inducible DNA-binding protein